MILVVPTPESQTLDRLLTQLRKEGVKVDDKIDDESYDSDGPWMRKAIASSCGSRRENDAGATLRVSKGVRSEQPTRNFNG